MLETTNNNEPLNRFNKKCQVNINYGRGVLLPSADLTLLSLTEVLGGIFWVWLPIFGINEVPKANTIIGGSIITFALLYYSLNTKRNRRFIGLN